MNPYSHNTRLAFVRAQVKSMAATLAAVGLMACAHRAMADVVYNVNFNGGLGGAYLNNFNGAGAAPDAVGNTFWNEIQASHQSAADYTATLNNLVASDGTTSSGVSLSVGYQFTYNDASTSTRPGLLGSWFQTHDGGIQKFNITGLEPGNYDLYLYGINGDFTGRGTRFEINSNYWVGGTPSDTESFSYLETTGANAASLEEGVNYVVFRGVRSYDGGIEVYYKGNPATFGGSQGPFNGLQLVRRTATVYNLNFSGGIGGTYLGNYTGVGVAPQAGTFWNQIQQTQNGIGNYNTSVSNLMASDGTTSSGITVSVDYNRAYNDTGISENNLLGSWFQVDGSVNGAGVGLVTISGLPAGSFDLYLYGINGGFTGRGTRFLFNSNYWIGGTEDPGNSSFHYLETTGASASSFEQGNNYVLFSDVQSFNGQIQYYIGANPSGGNEQGPFNGLQIVRWGNSASPYASWAAVNVGGQPANLSYNNDGVQNGIKFFMNAPPGFTANPALIGGAVTWPNGGNIPSSAYGTQFAVQTSSDLAIWSDVPGNAVNLSNTAAALTWRIPSVANGDMGSFVANLPSSWTVSGGALASAQSTINSPFLNKFTNNNSSWLIDDSTDASGTAGFYQAFSTDINYGSAAVNFDFMVTQLTGGTWGIQFDGAGANLVTGSSSVHYRIDASGQFAINAGPGGGVITNILALEAGKWYNVRAVFSTTVINDGSDNGAGFQSGTITPEGGSPVSWSNVPLLNTSLGFSRVLVRDRNNASAGDLLLDNIAVMPLGKQFIRLKVTPD